jgi:hypothetical protein
MHENYYTIKKFIRLRTKGKTARLHILLIFFIILEFFRSYFGCINSEFYIINWLLEDLYYYHLNALTNQNLKI